MRLRVGLPFYIASWAWDCRGDSLVAIVQLIPEGKVFERKLKCAYTAITNRKSKSAWKEGCGHRVARLDAG